MENIRQRRNGSIIEGTVDKRKIAYRIWTCSQLVHSQLGQIKYIFSLLQKILKRSRMYASFVVDDYRLGGRV